MSDLRPPSDADRILALLTQILRDRGQSTLRRQAETLALPLSTAYRLAARLTKAGLIRRCSRGAFAQGLELAALTDAVDARSLLAQIARPHVERLAQLTQLTAHLGVMEQDMVTYLVKVHGGGPEILTREGTQLEAYCSAIGKVLLAALPEPELQRYLQAGSMIPLTVNTISTPIELREALKVIQSQGFAVDAEEVIEHLRCIAVPVKDRRGSVIAALSVSMQARVDHSVDETRIRTTLSECALRLTKEL
jgi:IclR family acetate operon transcriptional repressor